MRYVTLAFAVLILTACTTTGSVTQDDIITIGVIAPLSGGEASLGENLRKGVDLAVEELNEKETRYTYKVVYEDDQLDNSKTAAAYHKLTSIDGADAIIGVSSGSGNVVAPVAEQDKILFCSALSSDINVVKGREYAFKHWVTPEEEAKVYIDEAHALGWDHIAVIEANQQGIIAIADAIAAEAQDVEMTRVRISGETKDIRTELTRLKGQNIDAFVLLLFPSQMLPAVKQVREFGFEQPLTSIELFEFIEDGLELLEGQWYVTAANPTPQFIERYEATYGEQPVNGAPHGYDCLNILVKGFEEGGREGAIEIIHNLNNYKGAAGMLRYNEGSIESPAVKKVVRDGRFEVAQ